MRKKENEKENKEEKSKEKNSEGWDSRASKPSQFLKPPAF